MKTLYVAAALALAIPSFAAAQSANGDGSVAVRYGDLNLNDRAGAAVMLHRLDTAALEACGVSPFSLREYKLAVQGSACHVTRMDQAVAELGAPAVTELYKDGFENRSGAAAEQGDVQRGL